MLQLLRVVHNNSLWETHLEATECHLSYGITQCYLPLTHVNAPRPNRCWTGRYSIYLPRGTEG